MKLTGSRKAQIAASIETIRELIRDAFPGAEDASFEIKSEGISLIGEDGEIHQDTCTPHDALDALIELQPADSPE